MPAADPATRPQVTRGAELVWPQRKRCYACRSYFGFEVIEGLYCSRACAGLAPWVRVQAVPLPGGTEVRDLPRSCRSALWARPGPRAKQRFVSKDMAQAAILESGVTDLEAYECPNCGFWHMGHKPTKKEWR